MRRVSVFVYNVVVVLPMLLLIAIMSQTSSMITAALVVPDAVRSTRQRRRQACRMRHHSPSTLVPRDRVVVYEHNEHSTRRPCDQDEDLIMTLYDDDPKKNSVEISIRSATSTSSSSAHLPTISYLLENFGTTGTPVIDSNNDGRTTYKNRWMDMGLWMVGTYAASCVLGDLLSRLEWMQTWRYTWPFGIGALYVILNILAMILPDNHDIPPALTTTTRALVAESTMARWTLVVLGIGLIIGGAYDAWMPVYMTGPNVVTAAGIGQDSAVGLFAWSSWRLLTTSQATFQKENIHDADDDLTTTSMIKWLPQILLLAELYKLGEGSFDELLFSKLFSG